MLLVQNITYARAYLHICKRDQGGSGCGTFVVHDVDRGLLRQKQGEAFLMTALWEHKIILFNDSELFL